MEATWRCVPRKDNFQSASRIRHPAKSVDLLAPILLVIIGLALIGVEIYLIPGMNIVGILGFLVLVFAIGFMFSTGGMLAGWITLLATVSILALLGWVIWKSGAWERFVLATSVGDDDDAEESYQENRSRYLGQTGSAVTPLRPTGVIEIENERIEVTTEGEFIAAGSAIKVVAMDRRHLFVRLAEALPEAAPDELSEAAPTEEASESQGPGA